MEESNAMMQLGFESKIIWLSGYKLGQASQPNKTLDTH